MFLKRLLLVISIIFSMFYIVNAETKDSPYKTINTFEIFSKVKNFDTLVSEFNFPSEIPKSERSKYIEKFKILLNIKVLKFDLKKAPTSPDYVDSASLEKNYYPFPDAHWIYLEKINDKWLFSSETVKEIIPEYEAEFFVNLSSFERHLPKAILTEFIGITLWKWFALAGIFILGFFIHKLFIYITHTILSRVFKKFSNCENFNQFIPPLSKPFSLLIVFYLASQSIKILLLPDILAMIFNYGFKFLIPFMVLVLLYRLCDLAGVLINNILSKNGTYVDNQIVSLIVKIAKVIAIIIGIMFIINSFGWNIMPLLAGASIGGLAFALAAQDTVKNLFASITLYSDKTFTVGDWIKVGDIEGVVEEIRIRTTRIRTFNNSLLTIPNNTLVNASIDNMGKRELRKYSTKFSLPFETPMEIIDKFVSELQLIILRHPNTAKDNFQVHFSDISLFAYEIMFVIHINAEDYTEELNTRHDILRDVRTLADNLNIKFAYYTQSLDLIKTD